MPEWLSSVICGLVEGATEFIPVSSTGHLLIVGQWLGKKSDLFNVVIQCGAALALVPAFWRRLKGFLDYKDPVQRDYLLKLIVSFCVTAAGCLIMKKFMPDLPESAIPVAWATLIGAFVILAVEFWAKFSFPKPNLTWTIALACAAGQIVAASFPGTSRSGACIIFAMAFGLARPAATEFSFLLGLPTLMAAGAKETLDALKDGGAAPGEWVQIAIGFVVSAISAFAVVKWLLGYVKNHSLTGFAIYRIILALSLFWFAAKGWIH